MIYYISYIIIVLQSLAFSFIRFWLNWKRFDSSQTEIFEVSVGRRYIPIFQWPSKIFVRLDFSLLVLSYSEEISTKWFFPFYK